MQENQYNSNNLYNTQLYSNQSNKKNNKGIIVAAIIILVIAAALGYFVWNMSNQNNKQSNEEEKSSPSKEEKNTNGYYYLTEGGFDYKIKLPMSMFEKGDLYGIDREPNAEGNRLIWRYSNSNVDYYANYFFQSSRSFGPEYYIVKTWKATSRIPDTATIPTEEQTHEKGPYEYHSDTYNIISGCEEIKNGRIFWLMEYRIQRNEEDENKNDVVSRFSAYIQMDNKDKFLTYDMSKSQKLVDISSLKNEFTVSDIIKYAGEIIE